MSNSCKYCYPRMGSFKSGVYFSMAFGPSLLEVLLYLISSSCSLAEKLGILHSSSSRTANCSVGIFSCLLHYQRTIFFKSLYEQTPRYRPHLQEGSRSREILLILDHAGWRWDHPTAPFTSALLHYLLLPVPDTYALMSIINSETETLSNGTAICFVPLTILRSWFTSHRHWVYYFLHPQMQSQ